jgi:Response regulator containing CheY-like receiver, AAA-type ATPase, and DNA-binding domains
MKKTRRIEITAFRRRVTVYTGNERSNDANGPSPSGAESWQSIEPSDRPTIDLGAICNATLDTTRVDKVCFPGKASRESEGNSSIAAEKFGLKRSGLYKKLRSLGLSIRNLKPVSTSSARSK